MARTPETLTVREITKLSPKELLERGINTKRTEIIPVKNIITDFALVDDQHARDLGESMAVIRKEQLLPILVRARLEKKQVIYDVIDGFHRVEGKRKYGQDDIEAKVLYGCDDQELFDLRILAVSSVKSVQFARVAEWMSRSFDLTPWAKRGLSVVQAFNIAVNDSETSHLVNLPKEEITKLKEWVKGRCKLWGKTLTNTFKVLRIAAVADPELVKQVKESGGGKDRTSRITQECLAEVAFAFPGLENHSVQRTLMSFAIEKRLSAEETKQLAQGVAVIINSAKDKSQIDFAKVIEEIAQFQGLLNTNGKSSSRLEQLKNEFREDLGSDIDEETLRFLEEEALEHDEVDEELVPAKSKGVGMSGHSAIGDLRRRRTVTGWSSGEDEGSDIEHLKNTVKDLRRALAEIHKGQTNGVAQNWWITAPYLTLTERGILTKLFDEDNCLEIEEIADELGLTMAQVIKTFQSAFKKRSLEKQNLLTKD